MAKLLIFTRFCRMFISIIIIFLQTRFTNYGTYKKRGAKKTQNTKDSATESRTEEVFSNLDTGAPKLEHWIATYQSQIFGLIFGIIIVVLDIWVIKVILNPKIDEANTGFFKLKIFLKRDWLMMTFAILYFRML